jgi:ankyrin repeat protein
VKKGLFLLVVLTGFSLPVMLASDVKLILRALYQPKQFDWQTLILPSWLANAKLRTQGISDCDLSFSEKKDTGPVINFLASIYVGENVDTSRVEEYIAEFVSQGCSPDEYDLAGMTPLHGAILFSQPQLVELLLDNNADATKRIKRPGKRVDNMQPLKFAKFLLASNPTQELKDIINILQRKR